jgi:UrcA family protein
MFAPKTRTFMPMALLAAVAMTCLQGAAFAGAVPMEANHRTAMVDASDLNLADPTHVAKLDDRIERAADKVCKPSDFRDLKGMSERPACKRTAIAAAASKRDVLVARAQSEQLAARQAAEPNTN